LYWQAGSGPVELDASEHMVDVKTGHPVVVQQKKGGACGCVCSCDQPCLKFLAGAVLIGALAGAVAYFRRR
jgi:hypothetical protein